MLIKNLLCHNPHITWRVAHSHISLPTVLEVPGESGREPYVNPGTQNRYGNRSTRLGVVRSGFWFSSAARWLGQVTELSEHQGHEDI